jgi:hypothetical protein
MQSRIDRAIVPIMVLASGQTTEMLVSILGVSGQLPLLVA